MMPVLTTTMDRPGHGLSVYWAVAAAGQSVTSRVDKLMWHVSIVSSRTGCR